MIKKLIVGDLQSNCYIVYNEQLAQAILFDPGSDYKKINRFLKEKQLTLKGIFLTHGHIDHIGATDVFLSQMPTLPVFIHKEDASFLGDGSKNLSLNISRTNYVLKPANLILLEDLQIVDIADYKVECRHYPGHTPGACMYFIHDLHAIFSGDVLFSKAIGRFDLPYGNRVDTIRSLQKIKELTFDYDVYPGHEEKTTLQGEILNNPYLQQV